MRFDCYLDSRPDFVDKSRSRTLGYAEVQVVDIGGDAFDLNKMSRFNIE
jgi:hypothetical protein